MDRVSQKDDIQESEYEFPYHHIVEWSDRSFSQTKNWTWGLRYYAGLQAGMDLLRRHSFESLLDVGCGDGRFLKEMRKVAPAAKLQGVDISPRAIGYARAFTQDIDFFVRDIINEPIEACWEAVTLIEVCEHIPPSELPTFINSVARALSPGGRLVITVPHVNKKLSPKHYQHFSSAKLRDLLLSDFEEPEFIYFDSRSRILQILLYALGGKGKHLVVTFPWINRLIFKLYRKHFHFVKNETDCLRIACSVRKKTC